MPPRDGRSTRSRLLKKLHARQPPSENAKFIVGGEHDDLPDALKTTVNSVLKIKYSDGMATYPQCKFQTIDVLWCQPPVETEDDSESKVIVPFKRTRFHIEYTRLYGSFNVDFLQYEPLPNDFSDDDVAEAHEAACTIDITNRKIAMEYTCSDSQHNGIGRGNHGSNYYTAIHFAVHGWVKIEDFASNTDAFRAEAVRRNEAFSTARPHSHDNLTRPAVFRKINASEVANVVNLSAYKQLNRMITTLPVDGKTMRMAQTPRQKASPADAAEELLSGLTAVSLD